MSLLPCNVRSDFRLPDDCPIPIRHSELYNIDNNCLIKYIITDIFCLCQVKLTIFIYTFHMEILFSERIRQLRKEAGLTQARLAKEIGITQRKLSYLESGQSEPDLETMWRLADYFDVHVDYMLGRTAY